ncbi:MAG: type II secretion system F family protein, partial [Deltaproteobacteria bacterium]|nr:type II secretion system F family protein [Deltaproteobacteria bacterium]
PDALDLLAVSVEAGMGLDAAIKRVGEEMRISNKVLSEEFGLLNLEMRAGKQRTDALRSMADRTGLEEMRRWVAMLIQTEKFGTSIGQALRVHSDSLRTRRTQQVEELAAKLPVKLLFPTIFFIFPTLFLVILGPAAIRVYRMFH